MGRGAGETVFRDYVGRMMLYEELHSKVINFYGYPVALLEEPTVMDAVKELVNDRKKLLADNARSKAAQRTSIDSCKSSCRR